MKRIVCGKEFESKNPLFLFHLNESDADAFCCPDCEKRLNIIQESDDSNEVKRAINYLYTCSKEMPDGEAKDRLNDIISSNASAVSELEREEVSRKPISERQQDFFAPDKDEGSGMFGNIGGKIKAAATVFCWIGIIVCVVAGIVLISNDSPKTGLLILFGGPLASWLSSLAMYGFGELIDEAKKNNALLKEIRDSLAQKK